MRVRGPRLGLFPALLSVATLLFHEPARAQSTVPSEGLRAADVAFREGVGHLDAGRFAEAAAAFERSLALHETAAAAYDLGLAWRALGDPLRALAAFERFLARARPDHPARPCALAAVAALRPQLAHVVVSVEGREPALRIDSLRAPLDDGLHECDLTPGPHQIEAQWPDRAPVRMEVALHRGEVVTIPFLEPAPPSAPRLAAAVLPPPSARPVERPTYRNPWLWVGVGAGVAALAAVVTVVAVTSAAPTAYDGGPWGVVVQGSSSGR